MSVVGLGLAVLAAGSAAQPASAAGLTMICPAQINQAVVADHFYIIYGDGPDRDYGRDSDRDHWRDAWQDRRDWREDRRDRWEYFHEAQHDWHQDQRDQERWQAWHQDQRDGEHDGGGWNHDH